MKVEIRPLLPADVAVCAAMVWDNWNPTVAMRFHGEVAESFLPNGPLYYVATYRGKVIGFAGMMPSRLLHGIWDFVWINVNMDYQNAGIGRQLTEYRIREVLKRDGRAIHLMTLHPAYFATYGFSVAKSYGDWHLMTTHLGELGI